MHLTAVADDRTIDISGDNTSSDYISYSQSISLPATDVVHVKMGRYVYFSSTINGSGTLNLYAGGERCYLGTEKGKTWPNWTRFTGDVHLWPFPENAPAAGFYGFVLAHGGKAFSPEAIEEGIIGGKVNISMQDNRVFLHEGATLCCEANTAGSGFRIGELQMEEGSRIQGYMKNGRAAYFIIGNMGTDGVLAGTIAPDGYKDDTLLGIIKEGTGTYSITGNNNYLSGALRVLQGKILVMNDRSVASDEKLRGALGGMANSTSMSDVAYVFRDGVLGGCGNIGGSVENYGTIEPGDEQTGMLVLKDYVEERNVNLCLHPSSVLRFKIASKEQYDQLTVDGSVSYSHFTEDFSSSEKMPIVEIMLAEEAEVQIGDEFEVLTTKNAVGDDWRFDVKANRYTWEVVKNEQGEGTVYNVRLVSFDDMADIPDEPHEPAYVSTMGAFYDDGIDDSKDQNTLRYYAESNGKKIGTAISMWKNDLNNANLGETKEVGTQFNMLVAENEMKWDALEPSRNSFSYGSADDLVRFAQKHDMTVRGHCLAWHSQLPQWISSDGKKNDKNWSREEALTILKNHITKVVTHYKGKVKEWDVVNECLDDDQSIVRSNPDGYQLRKSVWSLAIGDDFIDSAFVYAHRADPNAVLYLNEYGVEMEGKAKTQAFYNLAMHLKNNGIPIDGVGLQCHFSIGDVDSVKISNNIRRFGDVGMKCIITELDMGIPSQSTANLEEQARNYRVLTDIVLSHENCPCMVIWGLKDNNSWRDSSYPLLYTAQIGRKPAWYAVRSALRHQLTTSVRDIRMEETFGNLPTRNAAVYDLMGRQVNTSSLKPGIYIRDNRKFILK